MFTDTHCHILKEGYDNPQKIIDRCKLKRIIISGFDYESNKEALALATDNTNVYVSLGHFPTTDANIKENIEFVKKNINNPKVVGVGEIGLDYHYDNIDIEFQKEMFRTFLEIAESNKMPVIIHTRGAFQDTFNILKKYKVKGIIHSFTADLKEAKKYLSLGFYLGINGIVTFKTSQLINVLKIISINNIVLETDSPYLAPIPFRGEKNQPNNIITIANYLSQTLNIDINKLALITEKNVETIFDKASII